jgi:alkylated DNA repair dioxygenase AlkB
MSQSELFEVLPQLPPGLMYESDFVTPDQEAALLAVIRLLPLREAQYKNFTAKRRIISYGASYDFSTNELIPAGPIPLFLHPIRARIAEWIGVSPSRFTQALISEYQAGTQLGWHRDVPDFGLVAGLSLAGSCRMRFRPYPPRKGRNERAFSLALKARSLYAMQGEARWAWQHSIPTTKMTRYSITFRTRLE